MKRRGKSIAIATAVFGVVVLVAAGILAKDRIREEWYIRKLDMLDSVVRMEAADSLGRIRSLRGIPHLAAIIREDNDDSLRLAAVLALAETGPEAHLDALGALKSADVKFRNLAVGSLGKVHADRRGSAVFLLVTMVREEEFDVQTYLAIKSLSNLGSEAVPCLIEMLDDSC